MQASATFSLDRAYFQQSFEEWLGHRSKFRRHQVRIGALYLVAAPFAMWFLPARPAAPIVLVLAGLVTILEFYWYRRKWIRGRLAARSRVADTVVHMDFDDAGLFQKGPTSEGKMSWVAFNAVTETTNGIFFGLGDGMSIYVPKASIEPRSQIAALVQRARAGVEQIGHGGPSESSL